MKWMRRRTALASLAAASMHLAACALFDGPGDYPPQDAGAAVHDAGPNTAAAPDSAADAIADAADAASATDARDAVADSPQDARGDAREGGCQILGAACNSATDCCSGACDPQQKTCIK